ncbi:MAG: cell division topological specificity factor MinE [Clostridia bacterium]|nr:cell division topological specificity factor MinE [Clostridia bacterium]
MFNNTAKVGVDRLKKVLISDKYFNPERIKEVIKSDILYVLKNYTDVEAEDLNCDINIEDNGGYKINIDAICSRLKVLGSINE